MTMSASSPYTPSVQRTRSPISRRMSVSSSRRQVEPSLRAGMLREASRDGSLWTSCGPVDSRNQRFPADQGGNREGAVRGRNPAWGAGFRVIIPAGAAGLEPATPGFGDRCATNCATPLGCVRSVPPDVLRHCVTLSMQRYALAGLFSAIAVSLALVAAWAALSGGRAWVVALRRGGARALDGGSGPQSLAKTTGTSWPFGRMSQPDRRRILHWWPRRPHSRLTRRSG